LISAWYYREARPCILAHPKSCAPTWPYDIACDRKQYVRLIAVVVICRALDIEYREASTHPSTLVR